MLQSVRCSNLILTKRPGIFKLRHYLHQRGVILELRVDQFNVLLVLPHEFPIAGKRASDPTGKPGLQPSHVTKTQTQNNNHSSKDTTCEPSLPTPRWEVSAKHAMSGLLPIAVNQDANG